MTLQARQGRIPGDHYLESTPGALFYAGDPHYAQGDGEVALTALEATQGLPRATALAYLSAAADFEVSQVVDAVKGVHCMIRKADFAG